MVKETFPVKKKLCIYLDNQRLHIQAWGPQMYKIWWVSMTTAVDYIKRQYMTSSWACENNKRNNQVWFKRFYLSNRVVCRLHL